LTPLADYAVTIALLLVLPAFVAIVQASDEQVTKLKAGLEKQKAELEA
jgi:hypothetical protein